MERVLTELLKNDAQYCDPQPLVPFVKPEDQDKLLVVRKKIIYEDETFNFEPLRPDQVVVTPRSVELRRPLNFQSSQGGGASYENKSFERVSKPEESVVFGPRIIDHLFYNQPFLQYETRPDAMTFHRHNQESWFLTDMYEFRSYTSSNNSHHTGEKIGGFSTLLSKFRDRPHCLPNLVNQALNGIMPTPKEIIVPEDRFIRVTFISPSGGNIEHRPYTNFHLRAVKVPRA